MGQTLSHGVYLPNEGERNCYAGLASNWQILNTAVGAIAEKAPLVHTHTVSQITDFPAYGTTAGTICEGNDSRLSDARTPVAHTHTKSDVTDLLNSNFIPSANNAYDLGSSSYQWNNLYAKRVNTQSVNGINPGALSLPDKSKAMSIDTTNFAYNSNFTFTPTVSGWLFINVPNCTKASLKTGVGEYYLNQTSDWFRDTRPVIAGERVTLLLVSTATSAPAITLFPCLGNV